MKIPISMWQVGVVPSLLLLGQLAAAGPGPDVSTAGFGDAMFGKDIESIACKSIGKSNTRDCKMGCSYERPAAFSAY